LPTSIVAVSQDSLRVPQTEVEKVNIKISTVIKKEFIEVFSYTPKLFSQVGDIDIQNIEPNRRLQ
jgi:hypothetical protein